MMQHTDNWRVISMSSDYNSHWYEMYKWCDRTFDYYEWAFDGEGVFRFKHEQDLMWFLLRWAS